MIWAISPSAPASLVRAWSWAASEWARSRPGPRSRNRHGSGPGSSRTSRSASRGANGGSIWRAKRRYRERPRPGARDRLLRFSRLSVLIHRSNVFGTGGSGLFLFLLWDNFDFLTFRAGNSYAKCYISISIYWEWLTFLFLLLFLFGRWFLFLTRFCICGLLPPCYAFMNFNTSGSSRFFFLFRVRRIKPYK